MNQHRRPSPVSRQSGYVLIITLVFIVVITLAVGFFSSKVKIAMGLVAKAQQRSQIRLAMHSSLNSMLYRLAVVRRTPYGIGAPPHTARVDGHPYRDGKVTLQLIDQRGLVSLRYPQQSLIEHLLTEFGVPESAQPALFTALSKYIAAPQSGFLAHDDTAQYSAAALPPPAHRPLYSVAELRNVHGWAAQKQLWKDAHFQQQLTTAMVAGLNPNAATASVLATLPWVDSKIAQALISYRQHQPITLDVMSRITGLNTLQMQYLIFPFPSNYYRLTLSCACSHPRLQYNIVLTPLSDIAPWNLASIGYYNAGVSGSPKTTPLPVISPVNTPAANPFAP